MLEPLATRKNHKRPCKPAAIGRSKNNAGTATASADRTTPLLDKDALVDFRETLEPGVGQIPAPSTADRAQASHVHPVILIEIDPAVSGGSLANRFDVMLRGRVMSTAPIKGIRLQVLDRVNSTDWYGQPEPAAACAMPDGSLAKQQGFQFYLSRPVDARATHCKFQIIALAWKNAEESFEYAENFAIDIDPIAGEPVTVVAGPTRSILAFANAPPYTVMYIEQGTIDGAGMLFVQGWAVSFGPILAVEIFVGEQCVSEAKIGGERQDVAAVFPSYPNARSSGFRLTMRLDEACQAGETICARVLCSDGFGHEEQIPVEHSQQPAVHRPRPAGAAPMGPVPTDLSPFAHSLACQPSPSHQPNPNFTAGDDRPGDMVLPPRTAPSLSARSLAPRTPGVAWTAAPMKLPPDRQAASAETEIYCDEALLTSDGMLSLNGWAVGAFGIAQVRVLLDEQEVGLATFGHEREDVGKTYSTIPMAHFSGFRFERHIGGRHEGEHQARIVVRGARGEQSQHQVSVVANGFAASPLKQSAVEQRDKARPDLTLEQSAEFRFELDQPALSNEAMVDPVTGRLTIEGWLLTRSGVASFEVWLDDQRLGDAHYGLARQDVGSAFPEWPDALRSGFAFYCPPRSLRDGEHRIRLAIRANSGLEMQRSFRTVIKKSDEDGDVVAIRRRVPRVELDMMLAFLADMNHRPAFQFILRQNRSINTESVGATLEALRLQAYPDWTAVVLAEDEDAANTMRVIIDDLVPRIANRFSVLSPSNADAWEAPLALAVDGRSLLYALLLAGDKPGADALLELAVASGRHPDKDLLYGDEIRISPVSKEREPFFKPDFSPDLLLSTNYVSRLWATTAAVLAETGVTPASLVAAGEYDLVLRCTEVAAGVHHVPKLLCHRAAVELDNPASEQAALAGALDRRGIAGEVLATPIAGTWRTRRGFPAKAKVSIIIPTCAAHGYIETCINTLRTRTSYPDFEIICVDNIPASEATWKTWVRRNSDKVVNIPSAFNWSVFNNRAAKVADGEYLLFLNDDIEIIQNDWLDALVENAQRPEVGIVGPQLLYSDGKVQHAGMFLSANGKGRHAFRFAARDDPCYFGLALTQRNVIAVTGACMMVRRETFERLGRFDEAHQIINNDLDFCLRAHRAGLLTVYTPYSTLIHHELASRAGMKDVFDLTHFNTTWKTMFAAGDPYFNRRLTKQAEDYRPDDEPVQWVVSGAPMFNVAEIERILVVKLDHIGDFVTALPPIRRLRRIFPQAVITVLAGPASRDFISLEPSIDEFIPFSFFHARSQLGERDLTSDDYAALAKQLRPRRFDLAVDLRKHPSTRDVLKHTGARFLAGFDYLGQFPFLDIALDWDGDRNLQRKRSHIVDDLLALVNAIGHATENDRLLLQPGPSKMPLTELPAAVQALFHKPVVAIHPGAGNITKQWPEEHFSALIDLLIEKNDVNVMLVGGPDDVRLSDNLLRTVLHKHAIASMAGQTSLADLPRLLKNCVLYIGNDSGPKHIAAAIGVPTVGIHSGVVDPVEWGPIGPNAVALRRNMACSPCYLADANDCPRSLACLRLFEPSLVYETADLMLKPARPAPMMMKPVRLAAGMTEIKLPEAVAEVTSSAATRPFRKSPRNSKRTRRQRIAEPA